MSDGCLSAGEHIQQKIISLPQTQNNVSNAVETSVTPAKATPVVAVNKSTAKKQFITQRKRKKRKPSTSDESEYNSDDFD